MRFYFAAGNLIDAATLNGVSMLSAAINFTNRYGWWSQHLVQTADLTLVSGITANRYSNG